MNKFSILYCDFYHLTMIQALLDSKIYKNKMHNTTDTFEMFYRKKPFGGSYAIAAGIGDVVEMIKNWQVTKEEIQILRDEKDAKDQSVFSENFLDLLQNSKMELTIDAVKEGEVIFPNEPILSVSGPSWQTIIIETMILNTINAHSIIATKASRIYSAANKNDKRLKLLDFSLRRSMSHQGLVETKGAFIGGFDITSNVIAAKKYNLPLSGTHAHALVMKYGDELDAFKSYLEAMPDNGTLLVDTYNTVYGVKNAIEAAKSTKKELKAIRLDSGDLATLAKKARVMLDNAGFKNTQIVATNDLDEYTINSLLHEQNAPIDVFGVGTKMAIVEEGLGGVYKLKSSDGVDKIKVADQEIKTTIPGATTAIRIYTEEGMMAGDVIIPKEMNCIKNGELTKDIVSYNLANSRYKTFQKGQKAEYLLSRIFDKGVILDDVSKKSLTEIRDFKINNFAKLDDSHKRLHSPHIYVAGLEKSLYNRRQQMIENIIERV